MDEGHEQQIEAVVRRYLARVAVRFLPGAALLLAVLLVVLLVPGSGPRTVGAGAGAGVRAGGAPAAGGSAGGGNGAPGTAAGGAGSAGALGGGGGDLGSGGSPSGIGTAAGAGGTAGAAPVAGSVSASGAARTGVQCGAGVRQFPWSHYAPPCVAAFHGDNGGATAHGVTGTTITISYRNANSAQQAAVSAAAGGATPSDASYVQDMQTFVRWFNTQYELYGRHVVLVPFNGQGDYVAEDQGQDPAGAQADAVTAARSVGAFIDATFVVEGSQLYAQDLAAEHVINWDAPALPESWYQQYSPWEYNYVATGDNLARFYVDVVCQRMAGMPAIYAGDPLLRSRTRVIGLVSMDNPLYVQSADYITSHLKSQCGVSVARQATYSENTTTMETESASIVAQMRGAGATTVVCFCDPLMPIFLSNSADQQQYRPEWLAGNDLDPVTRDYASDQWAHAMSDGGQWPAPSGSEAYQAFQRAEPGGQPAEQYYPLAYYTLVQIFDALQAAGPRLNPQSFEQGMFSLPGSLPGGPVGTWRFGAGAFTPQADSQLGWWNPNATSNFDGKKGAWESCNGGTWYPFDNPAAYGGPRQQPVCFR